MPGTPAETGQPPGRPGPGTPAEARKPDGPGTPAEADWAFAGLAAQAALLRSGQASSAELVELALERAARAQEVLNPFRVLRVDKAKTEAAAADRRRAAGDDAPLLGVPVAIKDDTDLAGETTMFGCAGEFRPKAADCEAVRRLREAGAVVIGKTTTPELGQWPFTEGRQFGATRNPWNPAYSPGGSSGGSAAAVAAGVVPAALGSDGAGSVRIPAAWTHLVGVKPQRGRISTWPDREAFQGLTCLGPLARTVGDAALLLDAVYGNHPGDLHRPPPPDMPYAEAARREPPRLRVALSFKVPYSLVRVRLDPAIRSAVTRLAEQLVKLGHDVEEADPVYGVLGADFIPRSLPALDEWVGRLPDPSLLDPRTLANARAGHRLRPLGNIGRAAEALFARQVGRLFRRFDVLLTPTTALEPTAIGEYDGQSGWHTDQIMVRHCPYAWPWNVLGWPGVNVPAGFSERGLPIGAQLLGPACSEARLLGLAAQLQGLERWDEHRPPGW